MLLEIKQAFVGIDDLLQIRILIGQMNKRMRLKVVKIQLTGVREGAFKAGVDRGKNTSGMVSPDGDKKDIVHKSWLCLF